MHQLLAALTSGSRPYPASVNRVVVVIVLYVQFYANINFPMTLQVPKVFCYHYLNAFETTETVEVDDQSYEVRAYNKFCL